MLESFRRTGLSFLALCLAPLGLWAQLSGTYTINPTGLGTTNFTTLQAAVTALTAQGVSGPVSLLVAPGTTHPAVSIGAIAGTGPVNRVRFLVDSAQGVAPAVITTSGSTLYALQITGAKYLEFRNLVIQSTANTANHRVVELLGAATVGAATGNIKFSKCIMSAPVVTNATTNSAVVFATTPSLLRDISFYDVQFSGAGIGVYVPFSTNAALIPRNIRVQKSRFVNQNFSAAWFYSTDTVLFEDNTVRTASNSALSQRGIVLQGTGTIPFRWAVVRRNRVRLQSTNGGYGIFLNTFGTATSAVVTVENNAVYIPAGSGTNYGIYAFNTRRVHFFHNSVRVDKGIGSATSAVFSVFGSPGNVGDLQFRNNLCVSYGGSMAAAVNVNGATPSNVFTSFSHNIHYAPHSGNPFRFNNTNYATLAAWQTATSLDANSAYEDPLISESNLRTLGALADGTAVPVGTFVDFDNQARSGTLPDRGADEYGSATCVNPTVPTLVYARMQSIGLQWTSPNTTVLQRQIRYVRAAAQGTYWVKSNAQLTDSITGLQPLTDYRIWVRDVCAAGDTGLWVGPFLATTSSVPCAILAAPYKEDFEGLNWFPNPNNQGVGILDPCWNQGDTSFFYWRINNTATSTGFTGPSNDNTANGMRYLHAESRSGGSVTTTTVVTPWISLNTLNTAELKFASHRYGFAVSGLLVQAQVYPTGNWVNVLNLGGVFQTAKTDPWSEHTAPLNTFAGDTIRLRFTVTKTFATALNADVAIDDIRIDSVRTCLPPNTPSVVTATTTSVVIGWTATSGTGWQVQYGPSGFVLGSGTQRTSPTGIFTASGLSPATAYDFYVRDSCGPNNYSVWTKVFTASTLCGVVQTPWTENFDNSSFVRQTAFNTPGVISNCWSRSPAAPATGYQWNPAPPINVNNFTGPLGDHTGGGKFMAAFNTAFGAPNLTTNLRTPAISLVGLSQPELSFWLHGFGQDLTTLEVQVKESKASVTTWTTVLTFNGPQQALQAAPWTEHLVPLSNWVGDTVFVRFIGARSAINSNFAQWSLDDIAVKQAAPCPKPQQLQLVGTTSTSATLSWTGSGSSPWVLRYGPGLINPTGGTKVVANSNPFTLFGLNPSTSYSVYLKDSCSGSVSQWVGPIQFTTDCAPLATPYFENFDGSDFVIGAFTAGTLAPCWSRSSNAGYLMTPGPQGFPSTLTGTTSDHTTGSGKFIFSNVINTLGATLLTDVVSPPISTVPLDTPEVSFWYHMYGANIVGLSLEVYNGQAWTQVWSISGQQQTSNTSPWLKAIVSLASYQDDTLKLRFKASRNILTGFNAQVAIDDLDVHEQPSCPQPTSITATSITTTSASVNWLGTVGAYQISYGPVGHTPGAATLVTTSVRPYALTGLSASTNYAVYVRRVCGAGLSSWEGPLVFSTACGTVQAPWSESFDTPFWIPQTGFSTQPGKIPFCWTRTDTTNYFFTPQVGATPTPQSGPNFSATGPSGKYLYASAPFGAGGSFTRIITPWIDLTPLNVGELSFSSHRFGNTIVSLTVEATTNGTTWNTLLTFNGPSQTAKASPWQEHLVSLAAYNNATIKLRFTATRSVNGFNSAVAIDQLDIHEVPLCPKPTAMTVTATSPTTASVNWTGTAISGVIEYGPRGFVRGSGTKVYAPTKPQTITGLLPWTSYDFYVKDSCGAVNGASPWYGPDSTTTPGCTNGCNYTLTLTDQFSDGWSTTVNIPPYHFVTLVTGTRTKTYTLTAGSLQNFTIPVCPGQPFVLSFTNVGNFSNECGITVRNSANTIVYQMNPGINIPSGPLFTSTSTCSTCPPPTGGAISGISSTQATLSFTKNAAFADVAIGLPGFMPSFSTKVANVNSPYVFTGLTSSTVYHVYYRDSCGTGGNVSGWIGPLIFTTTNCPPVAAVVNLTSRVGNTIQVSNSGSTPGVTYTWSWGDATPNNTGATASHTYAAPGTYVVTLTVSNPCGSTSTSQLVVVICSPITANFYTLGTALSRNFVSNGTGQPTTYTWTWGDGTPNGFGSSRTHTFAVDGKYYVTLKVKNACGDSAVFGDTVAVCGPVTSSFTHTTSGSVLNATATSSANTVRWKWYFGDGTTGSGATPAHTYATSGSFSVRLVSYNLCGDSASATNTVVVCVTPVARFTATIISSSGAGMKVLFDATSSTGATQYKWFFGDGNSATGTNFVQHNYSVPSLSYVVTLIVNNTCGDDDTLSYRLSQIGLDETKLWVQNLYPNPVRPGQTVHGLPEATQSLNASLYALDGRCVHEVLVDAGSDSVDLPGFLPAGTYYLNWMGTAYRLVVIP